MYKGPIGPPLYQLNMENSLKENKENYILCSIVIVYDQRMHICSKSKQQLCLKPDDH